MVGRHIGCEVYSIFSGDYKSLLGIAMIDFSVFTGTLPKSLRKAAAEIECIRKARSLRDFVDAQSGVHQPIARLPQTFPFDILLHAASKA
jgi:hypothetical protein